MQRPSQQSLAQEQLDDYHHLPASSSSSSARRSAAASAPPLPRPPPPPPLLPPDPPRPPAATTTITTTTTTPTTTQPSVDNSSIAEHGSPLQRKISRRPTPLARIAIPSFPTFRSQLASIPIVSPSPRAFRAATTTAQPSPPKRLSYAAESSPRLAERSARSLSLGSPIHHSPYLQEAAALQEHRLTSHALDPNQAPWQSLVDTHPRVSAHKKTTSLHAGHIDRPKLEQDLDGSEGVGSTGTYSPPQTPKPMNRDRLNPSMTLEIDGVQKPISNESVSPESDKLSKSPGRLGAFFGWKASSSSSPQKPGVESPTTTYSERSLSPLPSPGLFKPNKPLPLVPGGSSGGSRARLTPPGIDITKANSNEARFFHSPETPILLGTAEMNAHVQELERELAQVSAELAGSIRREMDLEDELERLKMDHSLPPSEVSRRGSDYFSDSGAGSVRYPISDPDAKIQEEEKLRRKAEQDRAQIKLDMAQKTQSELSRRRDLEELVQSLEDQLDRQSSGGNEKTHKRVEELETQLEENRRRLNQEKEARANFEDLYTALQSELSSGRRHLGPGRGFGSIAEESDGKSGLSRSGSLARSGSMRAGSLNRSGSVKGRQRSGSNSAPVTAEGLQEVEDQRDALHKALKLLISRHDKQQKDHQRHIKKITHERGLANRLTGSFTSGRSHYHREVSVLKEEVTLLRKRTEDALEQKWQYEKSLGGIKMDLDRAEHETRGLRDLLQAHDILAPSPRTMQNATFGEDNSIAKPLLSAAEKDRDQARRLAAQFRKQATTMKSSGSSPKAVDELIQAATRMEQLCKQFDSQVQTNTALHHRLSAAIEKGEREQELSTRQIQDMQKKLAGMEDSLLAAQQHSENTLNKHENQVRSIEEASSPRLQRFTLGVPEPSKLSPMSPGAMRRSTLGGIKKKVQDATLLDASRTQMLERQVRELERMLRDAEDDMQYVVQRVNKSQIEVAELTNERDAAFMQMRKLQGLLVHETERAESLLGPAARAAKAYESGSDYGD